MFNLFCSSYRTQVFRMLTTSDGEFGHDGYPEDVRKSKSRLDPEMRRFQPIQARRIHSRLSERQQRMSDQICRYISIS